MFHILGEEKMCTPKRTRQGIKIRGGGRYETSLLVRERSARGRTARYDGSNGSVATPAVSRDLSPLADHYSTPSPIYLLRTRGKFCCSNLTLGVLKLLVTTLQTCPVSRLETVGVMSFILFCELVDNFQNQTLQH